MREAWFSQLKESQLLLNQKFLDQCDNFILIGRMSEQSGNTVFINDDTCWNPSNPIFRIVAISVRKSDGPGDFLVLKTPFIILSASSESLP